MNPSTWKRFQIFYHSDEIELEESGETFVEPDVVPPRRSDQVAEILVGQLVSQHLGVVERLIFFVLPYRKLILSN